MVESLHMFTLLRRGLLLTLPAVIQTSLAIGLQPVSLQVSQLLGHSSVAVRSTRSSPSLCWPCCRAATCQGASLFIINIVDLLLNEVAPPLHTVILRPCILSKLKEAGPGLSSTRGKIAAIASASKPLHLQPAWKLAIMVPQ